MFAFTENLPKVKIGAVDATAGLLLGYLIGRVGNMGLPASLAVGLLADITLQAFNQAGTAIRNKMQGQVPEESSNALVKKLKEINAALPSVEVGVEDLACAGLGYMAPGLVGRSGAEQVFGAAFGVTASVAYKASRRSGRLLAKKLS